MDSQGELGEDRLICQILKYEKQYLFNKENRVILYITRRKLKKTHYIKVK